MTIRLLYLTREAHPSFRPDLATLFGLALPQLGVHADLLAAGLGSTVQPWGGGEVYTRAGGSFFARLLGRVILPLRLFTLPRRRHYDAIQVRDRVLGALIGLVAARWHRLPFFYWMSFPFPEAWLDLGNGAAANAASASQRWRWRWRGRFAAWVLYRVVMPRADHLFVQSDAMRDMLVERGILADRMTPVPMGVKVPDMHEAIEASDDPRLSGREVVIYLGALERLRHPEVMIEAMRTVIIRQPLALLVLVGDSQSPGDRAWLEAEIVRYGLQDHAIMTGWKTPQEAWRYLRAARVGLSPFPRSRVLDVASPTKVCEYLAYGVAVIVNDQPDQAKLIEQTGGGLCVPMTADGFAGAIIDLLADTAGTTAMANRGRAAITGLRSYDVLARQLASQYRRLLG